ncbi:MAG: Mur ligase domain-containing protein [Collinsella sp.]
MPRVRYRLASGRGGDLCRLPGEKVDGNDFASRAIESGAGAVVMTREPDAELVSLAQDKDAPSC